MLVDPTFKPIHESVISYIGGLGLTARSVFSEGKRIQTGIYLNPKFEFKYSIENYVCDVVTYSSDTLEEVLLLCNNSNEINNNNICISITSIDYTYNATLHLLKN